MSDFVVSARKYRPSTFENVVGQKALTTTLKNAILQGKLSHAYLFCGPRGVGKTSCARIFAKTINCQNLTPEGEACNSCESCLAANEQRSYNIMELDAASNNSVNDIRQLIEQVYVSPTSGKYRVYIIDEVHMLSSSAFNAFLKTLEEPPAHAIFILATTEKHKVLPTIISRCQVHDFSRITSQDIADHLAKIASVEGIEAEPEALQMIGIAADGGMRDALSMFDQIAGFGGGRVSMDGVRQNLNLLNEEEYFRLLAYVVEGQHTKALLLINDLINSGYEGDIVMHGFSAFLRNVLMAQSADTVELIEAPQSVRVRMSKAGAYTPSNMLWNYLKISSSFGSEYKATIDKRLVLEVAVLKMCELSNASPLRYTPPVAAASTTPQPPQAPQQMPQSNPPAQSVPPQSVPPQATPPQVSQPPTVYNKSSITQPSSPPQRHKVNGAQNLYGFSLTKGRSTAEGDGPETKRKGLNRSEEYTEEALQQAWLKAVSQIQNSPLAKKILDHVTPTKTPDHIIPVQVQSNSIKGQVTTILGQVLEVLHNELQNDHIGVAIEVDVKLQELQPQTPKERWDFVSQDNAWLQKMAEELGLKAR